METIAWGDFEKVEIRVGRVVDAADFPEARKPAYILHVDFGPAIGIRKSSAQITRVYRREELIGPIRSECLVTGFHNEQGDVVLCIPDQDVPLGAKLL